MIYVHVQVSYTEQRNPIASQEGMKAMADFIKYMEEQTEFPGLKPIFVGWQDQRPPTGYGFFECKDMDQIKAFLKLMPNEPTIEIEQVNDMKQMAQIASVQLAAG